MTNISIRFLILSILSSLFLMGCDNSNELSKRQFESSDSWYQQGERQAFYDVEKNTRTTKNIILVVGDGMGITTLTAARIKEGQQLGLPYGEEHYLSFEKFPHSSFIKTYNTDQQTSDSAGTMTALVTGYKTKAGVLSVNDNAERGVCASLKGNEVPTLFDLAFEKGKATGIVTTARLTHATPAAMYAHSVERNWESDDKLTEEARKNGCRDIAQQLIDYQKETPLTVAFGGGRRHFLPTPNGEKAKNARRKDQKNLIEAWQSIPDHFYLSNSDDLNAMNMEQGSYLGLFASSHLEYQHQRNADQPSLIHMTQKAVQRLEQNQEGFVLMIEAGRIDHGHHAGNAYSALNETIELAQTVDWLVSHVDLDETLIIVTADHSHTFTLAGYNTRGADVLAPVVSNDYHGHMEDEYTLAKDEKPYTSANYRNGPGAQKADMRAEISLVESLKPNYKQQSLVPLNSETHGGEDVALYAVGPWSHLFASTMEQHWVYQVMKNSLKKQQQRSSKILINGL